MKRTRTKFLSILLTLGMVLTLLPVTAFAAEGDSADNPVVCTTFAQFKAAMESTTVTYVKLNGVNSSDGELETHTSLAAAVSNTTSKVLTVEGTNTFFAPLDSNNDCLIWPRANLTINGTGTLKYQHGNSSGAGAVISMYSHVPLTINGSVSVEGAANGATHGYAIFATDGTIVINGGTFVGYLANTAYSSINAVNVESSANITINGGSFSASAYSSVTDISPNAAKYSVNIGGTGTKQISGGTFHGIASTDNLSTLLKTGYAYFKTSDDSLFNGSATKTTTETLKVAAAATVPGAPTGLTATPGNGQVTLSWTAPASNGGSAITRYEYMVGAGSWTTTGSTATTCTVTGLTNGTEYSCRVRAVNAVGEGVESTEAKVTPTSATVPAVPRGLTATPGDGQVTLSWTAPLSDGGSAITRYEYMLGGGSWTTTGSTATTCTVTGLTNGTEYSCRVRAVNAVGNGEESNETKATPVVKITSIVITGVIPPVAGEHPTTVGINGGTGYTITPQWNISSSGAVLTGSDTFEAGTTYTIYIDLAAKNGYEFANSMTATTINGNAALYTNKNSALYIKYNFTVPVATPTITSVSVTPATANVQKGTTQQFTAAVNGTGAYNNNVAWTVTGGGAGTSISTSGLLTVASDETASTLTVKATANGDDTKTDTANVTVTDAPVTTYALTVTNGSGDGNYEASAAVNIAADAPAAGKQFKNWTTSDGGSFGNASSAATTYTMPAGAATVTANYENIPVTVSSIAVNSTTHKTAYTVGNALDVTNLTILVTKSDASTETVNVTSSMVTGFDSSTAAASQTLTITYEGKTTTLNISITAAPPVFVAVTGITGVPTTATAGTPLTLTGTVAPANATNKTIVWSVKSAGTTGASISGSTLSTTAAGTVKITATITNGLTASSNYTQDFDIIVSAAPISTHIVTVNDSYAGTTGAGSYAKDATVNIYAGNRSNYSFNGWTVVSGGVTITNPGSKNASFTMPNNAVTVKANWSYNGGGSSGGGTSYNYYTITATAGKGGSISPSGSTSVREDLDKTYTVTPNTGYVISDVLVDGKSVGAVKTYTFKDVSAKHTISATFKVDTHTNPQTGVEFDFDDVKETDWFYEDAVYAFVNSLMNGTGAKTFSPNANTTRGMIVAILHRLAGEPEVTNAASFTDVFSDKYYAKAIAWAYENKIVSGYSAESFGPDDAITREQMATILMNYAKLMGYDVTAAADLSTFSDAGSISGYAKLAMQWANAEGLVSGKGNGILDPDGNATRAQVAAILHRFCENIVK